MAFCMSAHFARIRPRTERRDFPPRADLPSSSSDRRLGRKKALKCQGALSLSLSLSLSFSLQMAIIQRGGKAARQERLQAAGVAFSLQDVHASSNRCTHLTASFDDLFSFAYSHRGVVFILKGGGGT